MSRRDFRAVAARRLSEDRELSPAIVSLISSERADRNLVRQIPLDRIEPNPRQPRLVFEETSLEELTASIREHGVLQPILVRPIDGGFQLIAGERRWRATRAAGLTTIPALVEEIDDQAAMEIAIIENLQREDLSPLDEAIMYDRMVREYGYSVRGLAQKLGKDKGYVENRLRLADAPDDVKQLVSVRKDTLSHAYELMKVADPARRAELAELVATGQLSLIKLKERIDGRPARPRLPRPEPVGAVPMGDEAGPIVPVEPPMWTPVAATAPAASPEPARPVERAPERPARADAAPSASDGRERVHETVGDDALVQAKQRLSEAIEELGAVIRAPHVIGSIDAVDRANLAKYLTIAKLRIENAIAIVRTGDTEG